jgi:hypothetical protein
MVLTLPPLLCNVMFFLERTDTMTVRTDNVTLRQIYVIVSY